MLFVILLAILIAYLIRDLVQLCKVPAEVRCVINLLIIVIIALGVGYYSGWHLTL